jgi:hypothetical protein
LIGWGSSYDNKNDKKADKVRQGNDETIKRSQGDESGLRDVKREGPLQNDELGRF